MNQFSPETIDLLNDNFVSSKMLYTNTEFVVPPNEKVDANEYTNHSRVLHQNLKNDQNLLVALALVVPSERLMFKVYPEELFVETTTSHHRWL